MAVVPYNQVRDPNAPRQEVKQDLKGDAVYNPTPEEKEAIDYANKVYKRAKQGNRAEHEKMPEQNDMYAGRQWRQPRPSYRHSDTVNLIFQTIQSQVPILLDSRPKISYTPQEPSDRQFADLMNQLIDADWKRNNWSGILTELEYDAHRNGTGISSLMFDPSADGGIGSIVYRSLEPMYVFPHPRSRGVNVECEDFTVAEPVDINTLKMQYPDQAKFLRPDLVDLVKQESVYNQPIRYITPSSGAQVYTPPGGTRDSNSDKDMALKITVYCKCNLYDEEESEQPDGTKVTEKRLRYPSGRKIVICNDVLLEDGANPYDNGKFPYQSFQNYIQPRRFWGMSEVEQLMGPQRVFNKVFCFALDTMTTMSNPIWIVSSDSGIDVNNLINRPGLAIEKEPGSEVRREEGVQLQPYIMQLANTMKEWFEGVAGSQDVTRGATPNGITAASAISQLQEAAQTRIRQKARNLDLYLQDLGQQYADLVMQYYDVPRVVRITGDDNAERYFKFHVETREEMDAVTGQPTGNTYKAAVIRPYTEGEDGAPQELDAMEYILRGKLDVQVTTGSALPFAKAERENKLYQLFDRQIIDGEEVLKNLDYPNAQNVLDRMAQKQQAAAEAAAQAQAGGAQPAA